jgi:D-alanyl-D-alanine carboxypeptidase (penicillin-binding protein 5/6)
VAIVATHAASIVARRAVALKAALVGVPAQLQGPIAAGTQEGAIDVTENGKLALTVPLVTQVAVAAPPATSSASLYGAVLLALIVLGGCSLRVMRTRARRKARRRTRRVPG